MELTLVLIFSLIILLLLIEGGLRFFFGFGNPLLYIADEKIGYLLAPNQRVRRRGNRIEINQFSMRSPPISPSPSPEMFRILLLGDSVANGGWWTDRDRTISQLMQQQLTAKNQPVEVLNASANSWSPRNELAYLQQFGLFSSHVLILLINTDDLFGTAPTSLPVGRDRTYPDRKPPFALAEVYSRFWVRPQPIPEMLAIQQEKGDRVGINLNAIAEIDAIATEHKTHFILAMTPLLREIGDPGSRDYEKTARQRLQDFSQTRNIIYIDFLPLFQATGDAQNLYRDHIHLSPEGNDRVSQTLCKTISNLGSTESVMLN